MTRTLSTNAIRSINSRETDQVWLAMVLLSHPDWVDDVALVQNTEPVDHGGITYQPYPFSIRLPDEGGDTEVPVVAWSALNVQQELTALFRSVTGPINGSVFWVLADSPNTIEIGPMQLQLRAFQYDSMTMSGSLVIEPVLDAVFGSKAMDSVNCPGLF